MKEVRLKRTYIVQFHLYEKSRRGKSVETVVAWGWDDTNVLELYCGDGRTAWSDGYKSLDCTFKNGVNFMVGSYATIKLF